MTRQLNKLPAWGGWRTGWWKGKDRWKGRAESKAQESTIYFFDQEGRTQQQQTSRAMNSAHARRIADP